MDYTTACEILDTQRILAGIVKKEMITSSRALEILERYRTNNTIKQIKI